MQIHVSSPLPSGGIYCIASDAHVAFVSREGSRRRSRIFQSFSMARGRKFSRRNHSRLRLNLNLAFPFPPPRLCFLAGLLFLLEICAADAATKGGRCCIRRLSAQKRQASSQFVLAASGSLFTRSRYLRPRLPFSVSLAAPSVSSDFSKARVKEDEETDPDERKIRLLSHSYVYTFCARVCKLLRAPEVVYC